MAILTNEQIIAFSNTVGADILNSGKKFKTKTAFKLADFFEQITPIINGYNTSIKSIVENNGGTIAQDGMVTYDTPEHEAAAMQEINTLKQVQNDVSIQKIKYNDFAAELTIREALLLKPLADLDETPI